MLRNSVLRSLTQHLDKPASKICTTPCAAKFSATQPPPHAWVKKHIDKKLVWISGNKVQNPKQPAQAGVAVFWKDWSDWSQKNRIFFGICSCQILMVTVKMSHQYIKLWGFVIRDVFKAVKLLIRDVKLLTALQIHIVANVPELPAWGNLSILFLLFFFSFKKWQWVLGSHQIFFR